MLAYLTLAQYRARMVVRAKTLGRVGMVWDNMGSNPGQTFSADHVYVGGGVFNSVNCCSKATYTKVWVIVGPS